MNMSMGAEIQQKWTLVRLVTTGSGPNIRWKFQLNELISLLDVNCTLKDPARWLVTFTGILDWLHILPGIGFSEAVFTLLQGIAGDYGWRLFTGWLILRDRNFVPWFWPENYFVKQGWNRLSFRLPRTHEWYSRIFLARNRKIYDCRCIQPHLALTRGGCASTQSIDAEQLKGL